MLNISHVKKFPGGKNNFFDLEVLSGEIFESYDFKFEKKGKMKKRVFERYEGKVCITKFINTALGRFDIESPSLFLVYVSRKTHG